MSELTVVQKTPEILAAEINGIRDHAKKIFLQSSVEIGRRLCEAKEQLVHGQWIKWLESSVDYSQSTANNLMQIAREYSDKLPTLGNLNYTQALALLSVPAEEREQFVAENDVDNMSAKQLQQAIKDKQKLEEKLAKSEALAAQLKEQNKAHADKVHLLSKQIEEAEADFDDEKAEKLQAEFNESQTELAASLDRIKKLETQLKEQPIDVSAVVEKIPEEVEVELIDLRLKVSQQQGSESVIKFKVRFEALVNSFRDLLGAMGEVTDPDEQAKCRNAVSGLIGKMSERL